MGVLAVSEAKPDVIVSYNPATGEALGEVPVANAAAVRARVNSARAAQKAWAKLSVEERCERVSRIKGVLSDRCDEICKLLSKENGKTKLEAQLWDVAVVAEVADYFCSKAPEILAPEQIPLHLLKHRVSYLHFQPRGVVGIISPWNLPISIPGAEMVMALIAGNAVVLKPSEITPLCGEKLKEIFDAARIPPDLVQVVQGRGDVGAALIDAGIDYCVFTGSTATGKKVGAACAERLIPFALELGGKAPVVVCADANIERTARAVVWAAFSNQGQACVSFERVYVHEAIYDELLTRIVAHTNALRLSAGAEGADTDCGSMTWERQVEHVERLLKGAVEAGAKIRTGGKRSGRGLQFEPTVLTDVKQDMEIMHKEIFGPVMPIMKVSSEDEAVRLANDSHLGLGAAVFSQDRDKAVRLAEKIEAGMVIVNDMNITYSAPETPWMGIKGSGMGLTRSAAGLRELCQARHVNYDRFSLGRELWWYPYSEKFYKQVKVVLKWWFR